MTDVAVCRFHLTERTVLRDVAVAVAVGDDGSDGGARGRKMERIVDEIPVGERSVGSYSIRRSWLERKLIVRDAYERREIGHKDD